MSSLPDDSAALTSDPLAIALEAARTSGQARPAASFDCPADFAAAYRTQAARWTSRPVPGWKVAIDKAGQSIFAPLDPFWQTETEPFPWHQGLGLEIEFAYVLAHDLPARPDKPYDRAEIEAAIASVHLGIEVIRCRIAEGNAAPFPLFLADCLANGGYILGPQRADDCREGGRLHVAAGASVLFDGPAIHPAGDPLLPLIARANRQAAGWGDLVAGQIVTTGSFCGVLPCAEPGDVVITLGSTTMTARFHA